MNKKTYKLLTLTIPIFFLFFFIWLSVKRTDGFTTGYITRFDRSYKNDIQISSDVNEIKSILSQNFYYLTRGKQSFIFESNDQKYILKFFDKSRFFGKVYLTTLPILKFLNIQRNEFYNKKKSKLEFDISSAKIAYELLKDDAALVYVNLSKTNLFEKKLCITNKCKRELYLDLNDAFFILQKKCDMFYPTYEKLSDDISKYNLLDSFLEMVHRRTIKCVVDNDIGKNRTNWGVLDNKAVTIDIGRWYLDDKLTTFQGYKKHMLKATITLKNYLLENDPKKLDFVEKKLQKYFEDFK